MKYFGHQRIHLKTFGKAECQQTADKVDIFRSELLPGNAEDPKFQRRVSLFNKLIDTGQVGQRCFLIWPGRFGKIPGGIFCGRFLALVQRARKTQKQSLSFKRTNYDNTL